MILPALLVQSFIADAIASSNERWGTLDLKHDVAEHLLVVSGFRWSNRYGRTVPTLWQDQHYTRGWSAIKEAGYWYRAKPELHDLARFRTLRGGGLTKDELRQGVLSGWQFPGRFTPILTYARRDDGSVDWCGWAVVEEHAFKLPLDIYDPEADLLAPLDVGWPRNVLAGVHVTVVGVGSIGSAACEALASYGIRKFALIDNDRLMAHNFARHRAIRPEHGRLKVNAVRDLLRQRDAQVEAEALPLDVVSDADQVRPLLRRTTVVLGCPDGTRPRRMTSHLAFWAGRPVVLACVLEQGAFGEVLRLMPRRTGCLLCNRDALDDAFDPEVGLDAGYDAQNPHLPMTAVTGDLTLVGQLAAKVVVATLLERAGHRDQRLRGDHAVLSLRPAPDFPQPFDFSTSGEINWISTAPARSSCPSCGTYGI